MLDLSLGNWRIWYEKVWTTIYLVPSDTKVLKIYFLKNKKCYMMSSCMTKLEFLPESYILFRVGKLPHICFLLLHWVLSSFVDPYETFVMLLKSRSRTHHPEIFYSYAGSEHKNMLDLSLGNWRIWYEKVWAAIYFIPSETKVLEIYL